MDFGARIYDSRIGRWLSIDPKSSLYPMFTTYGGLGDNPIWYIDPGGETLRVAGSKDIAKKDIANLLPAGEIGDSYRSLIEVSDKGDVAFNITEEQAYASGDAGVVLLYNLTAAKENYEYNVSDEVEVSTISKGGTRLGKSQDKIVNIKKGFIADKKGNKQYPSNLGLVNASNEPAKENLKGAELIVSDAPKDVKVDGQVTIPAKHDVVVDGKSKPRESLVFHELLENYNRTTGKQTYKTAHNNAITGEKTFKAGDKRQHTGKEGKGYVLPKKP